MKTISIVHGIIAALLITCIGSAAGFVLLLLFPWRTAVQAEIALAALFYLGYLFYYSGIRAGKFVLGAASMMVSTAAVFYFDAIGSIMVAAVGLIWIMRALLYADGMPAALADLGLCLLGAAFSGYVFLAGYGVAAALWCFLLAQALWAYLPKRAAQANLANGSSRFNQAYALADAALKKLASNSEV